MKANMPTVSYTPAMNTAAISAMQRGSYGQAIEVLKRTLAVLKASLHTEQPCVSDIPNPAKARETTLLWSVAPPHSSQEETNAMAGSSNNFELFQSAFHLPDKAWCSANKSNASVVLLYNMGLSYHLRALTSGSSKDLKTAGDLYKMALSVVESCLPRVYTDRFLLLQLLALFNNLGHVHVCCFDEPATKQCLTAIRALLNSKAFFSARCEDSSEVFAFFEWSTLSITPNTLFLFAPAA